MLIAALCPQHQLHANHPGAQRNSAHRPIDVGPKGMQWPYLRPQCGSRARPHGLGDIFLPGGDSRRRSRLGTLRRRLRWPLGIYTTPVVILVVWEVLAQAGVLKPTYAPAPTDILARR